MKTLLVTLILVSGQIGAFAKNELSNLEDNKKTTEMSEVSKPSKQNVKSTNSNFLNIKEEFQKDFFSNDQTIFLLESKKEQNLLILNFQKNIENKIKEVLEPCPVFRPCQ